MAVVNSQTFTDSGKMVAHAEGFATSGDASNGISLPAGAVAVSVQAEGDFTGSLAIDIEGSNDGGSTWTQLSDTGASAVSFNGEGLSQIEQLPDMIRGNATGGTGGGDANLHFVVYSSP